MKPISGWTRLWIVASALWCAGAAIWLTPQFAEIAPRDRTPNEICAGIHQPMPEFGFTEEMSRREVARCTAELSTPAATASQAEATRVWTYRFWLMVAVAAAAVLAVPLLVAGVWAIGRWVQRGFQRAA